MALYRRWFQNPYYQVCKIPVEHLNGSEKHPDTGEHIAPPICTMIGEWYFGNGVLSPKHQYPLKRLGPYRSYSLALKAAQKYYLTNH